MTQQTKNKLFANKRTVRWAILAAAIALAVTVLPYIAWGNLGEESEVPETIPVATPISEADFGDAVAVQSEDTSVAEQTQAVGSTLTIQAAPDAEETATKPTTLTLDASQLEATIEEGDVVSGLVLVGNGTFSLTINGTLNCDIKVGSGQVLNLYGSGTLNPGSGSQIEGKLNISKYARSAQNLKLSGTIKLDGDLTGTLDVPAGQELTLEGTGSLNPSELIVNGTLNNNLEKNGTPTKLKMAGESNTQSITVNGTFNSGIEVAQNKTLTINGNGGVVLKKDSLLQQNAILKINDKALQLSGELCIQNGAKLEGSFTSGDLTLNSPNNTKTTGTAVIKDLIVEGTFNNNLEAEADKIDGGKENQPTALKLLGDGDHQWEIKGTLNSAINVAANQTLKLTGSGTVDGTNKKSSVVVVDGANAKLELNGPTITGGTGSTLSNRYIFDIPNTQELAAMGITNTTAWYNNNVRNEYKNNTYKGKSITLCGGGILVKNGANLIFNSGSVENNTAQAGGGIFIDRDCDGFQMNGGSITNNSTIDVKRVGSSNHAWWSLLNGSCDFNVAHEGGGLYIASKGVIAKATISGNHANSVNDWGGGGIFIESKGKLEFKQGDKSSIVVIRKNTADGLGGGVSGCPHARNAIGEVALTSDSSVVIAENTAKMERSLKYNKDNGSATTGNPGNPYLWSLKGLGDLIAYSDPDFTKDDAHDYYGTYISVVGPLNYSTNGEYSWTGRRAYSKEIGNSQGKVDYEFDKGYGVWIGKQQGVTNGTLGLTAAVPASYPQKIDVLIEQNDSKTHGGGIGVNGELCIGGVKEQTSQDATIELDLNKELDDLNGESALGKYPPFSFTLYKDSIEDKNKVGQPVTNAANGKIRFPLTIKVDDLPSTGTKPFTYFVKENAPEQDSTDMKYDRLDRKIVITVSKGMDTTANGKFESFDWVNGNIVTYYPKIESTDYFVKNEKGEWVSEVTIDGTKYKNNTFVNLLKATGDLSISKTLYGASAAEGEFTFKLTQVEEPVNGKLSESDLKKEPYRTAKSPTLAAGKTETITFKDIDYSGYTDGTPLWFMVTEESGQDPSIYVIKVKPEVADDGMSYKPTILEMYRGVDADNLSLVYKAGEGDASATAPTVAFNNYMGELEISKSLYGASATEGEFIFNLTQVEEPVNGKLPEGSSDKQPTYTAKNPALASGETKTVVFENINYFGYTADTPLWFMVTEESGQDPSIYVIKVKPEPNGTACGTTILEMYRGVDADNLSLVYKAGEGDASATAPTVAFNNYMGELEISKSLYGTSATEGEFIFNLTQVEEPVNGKLPEGSSDKQPTYTAKNPALASGETKTVVFENINYFGYTADTPLWFMVTEESGQDPSIYVIKVKPEPNGTACGTTILEMYYGTDPNDLMLVYQAGSDSNLMDIPNVEFTNYGSSFATMSVAGYSIYAASGTPVELECFVDPKIIKELQGRPLHENEFKFKLIQIEPDKDGVVDWSKTDGIVVGEGENGEKIDYISQTTNDQYGMVDFDKAHNVGTEENPTCLAYTAPGTYYYRVVEVTDSHDPAVNYSREIITFTTVIERTDKGLECTKMYYGKVEDGENVPYEQSLGNPNWHPTMVNYAKQVDLKVRKTSALTKEGLEGATYGLYMVSNGSQADLLLGEEKSDADGWITFKNVNLNTGGKYYFKEIAAPAGHTVSDLRTYFTIEPDSSAPNGYVIVYENAQTNMRAQAAEDGIMLLAEGDDQAVDEGANLIVTYKNGEGIGVQDEATLIEFAKLNADTGARVEGAELSIVEKETGKVVTSWTTGAENFTLEGVLDVEKTYILREDSAPEGFAKAAEVEFKIENYGRVEILRGATVASGTNAEAQGATILLYDQPGEGDVGEPTDGGVDGEATFLAKTGDILKIAGIVILAIAAICGIVFAVRRRNKSQA